MVSKLLDQTPREPHDLVYVPDDVIAAHPGLRALILEDAADEGSELRRGDVLMCSPKCEASVGGIVIVLHKNCMPPFAARLIDLGDGLPAAERPGPIVVETLGSNVRLTFGRGELDGVFGVIGFTRDGAWHSLGRNLRNRSGPTYPIPSLH